MYGMETKLLQKIMVYLLPSIILGTFPGTAKDNQTIEIDKLYHQINIRQIIQCVSIEFSVCMFVLTKYKYKTHFYLLEYIVVAVLDY